MRRIAPLLMLAALAATSSCRQPSEGPPKVIVIGSAPKLRDNANGPLSRPDQVLIENSAQGLVRFDPAGNIVAGLAERWNVSDDGLSYIFRLAPTEWPGGGKVTADQVARLLKRDIRSGGVSDRFGAIEDIVAMTDRVIEITLVAPRPDLLSLLAQPELGIVRNGHGTGPFRASAEAGGLIKLEREIVSADDESTSREELLLGAAPTEAAVRAFAAGEAALILGGTFADLPIARRVKVSANALRFDPASGLFGLMPLRSEGPLAKPQLRRLLSQAIDREAFIDALKVPALAPRATLLEPGLDVVPQPVAPAWMSTPHAERIAPLRAQADSLLGSKKPSVRILLPDGPGADLLLRFLQRDWGALGLTVERANDRGSADFILVDEVAPSPSPAWFVRHFRCGAAPVCSENADELMAAARQSPVPPQRSALLAQAAMLIDNAQLFLPIAAPVRWSLVSDRIVNFTGNRYARHTLTGLEVKASNGD